VSSSEFMRRPPLRIGIVGAGYVSRHHIEALRRLPFVRLVGIADINYDAAQAAAQRYGIPLACRKLEELATASPEAIYLLTPPHTHCPLALQALDMGCHVFVEKPMAETAEECDRMIARARETGLALSVNHSDKFDPVVQRGLRLVLDGACGQTLAADVIRSSSYAPYAGGPLPPVYSKGSFPFQDLGVHSLYLLEAFLGPIEQLDVEFRSTGRDPDLLFDEWFVQARCARGTGRAYLSWNVRPMQNRIRVYCSAGVVEMDRFLQLLTVTRSLPGPKFPQMVLQAVRNSACATFVVPWNVLRFFTGRLPPSPGIRAGAVAFARALYEGVPPPVSADEGRRMVHLMEEASRAADEQWRARRRIALAPLPPASCLVTGASGFLGRALLNRLRQQGVCVRVLVRREVPEWREDKGIQIVLGNLGDPEVVEAAVRGVQTVFHVGAAMKGSRESFQAGTVWGTRNIVDACLKHGVRRLVHVSSLSVLDHASHRPGTLVTESWPLEPFPERRGWYTQTKLQAERIVLEAVREHGLDAVILRPGQIFGPGAANFTPSGAISLAGRWWICGSGRARLPLVFVEDVVDALLLAAEARVPPGSIFHLVDPTPVTQREYVAASRLRFGAAIRVRYVPRFLLMLAAYGVACLSRLLGRDLPLSPYRVRSLRPLSELDCSAAHNVLGWRPRIGVRRGLELTFAAPEQPRHAEPG